MRSRSIRLLAVDESLVSQQSEQVLNTSFYAYQNTCLTHDYLYEQLFQGLDLTHIFITSMCLTGVFIKNAPVKCLTRVTHMYSTRAKHRESCSQKRVCLCQLCMVESRRGDAGGKEITFYIC